MTARPPSGEWRHGNSQVTAMNSDVQTSLAVTALNPGLSALSMLHQTVFRASCYSDAPEILAGNMIGHRRGLCFGLVNISDDRRTSFPRTKTEISIGVTPTNYSYPPNRPERYGAVFDANGEAGTDDTDAINTAIAVASASGGGEVVIDGPALVSARKPQNINDAPAVTIKSGVVLKFISSGSLHLAPNAYPGYEVIRCLDTSNFTIEGAKIFGDRSTHLGKNGEWGHGIALYGCSNFEIDADEISDCWGDGLILQYDSFGNPTRHGKIYVRKAYNNRRQGMSIISAEDIDFFVNANGTHGTSPGAAVDLEPDYPTDILRNIRGAIVSSNNQGSAVLVNLSCLRASSEPVDVKLNVDSDRDFRGISVTYAGVTGSRPTGRITFVYPTIRNTRMSSIWVQNKDVAGPNVVFMQPTMINAYSGNWTSEMNKNCISIYNGMATPYQADVLGGIDILGGRCIDNRIKKYTHRVLFVQNVRSAIAVSKIDFVDPREVSGLQSSRGPIFFEGAGIISDRFHQMVLNVTGNRILDGGNWAPIMTNRGASGPVTVTYGPDLPFGFPAINFEVLANHNFRVFPGDRRQIVPLTTAAGKYLEATEIGAQFSLVMLTPDLLSVRDPVGALKAEP